MKKCIYALSVLWSLFATISLKAQQDSIPGSLSITGYAEIYYSYDSGEPFDHTKPSFIYSHNRHNEVNLNLAFIKAAYLTTHLRANLAFMAGTYSNANLAAEEGVLKNIYEANAGVKLLASKNLWVDAGIFSSHIGFESAAGKDCWNLTRSLLADNSPYYESGVKISYTSSNEKWFASLLYLNGWQTIQRKDGYNTPAFGHQITYTPSNKLKINSSSFIGSNTPDSTHQLRYFHNLYGIIQWTNRLAMTAGFDIGAQQTQHNNGIYDVWYSPVVIVQLKATDKLAVAARGEYYHDPSEVIIATGTLNGFQTTGISLNVDLTLYKNILWRLEGKFLQSKDALFLLNKKSSRENYMFTTALAISF